MFERVDGGQRTDLTRARALAARAYLVGPMAMIGVAITVWAIVRFGPKPVLIMADPEFSVPGVQLSEPRDRVVLVTWWLGALALAAVAAVPRPVRLPRGWQWSNLFWILGGLSVLVASAEILLDRPQDNAGLWPTVTPAQVATGAVFTITLLLHQRVGRGPRRVVTVALLALATWMLLPSCLQTVSGIRDVGSFTFAADELAAPAIGRIPYANFAPQYSALLGLPIDPLLVWFPQHSIAIVLGWMQVLQLTTIATAMTLLVRAAGSRYLLPLLLLVVAPAAAGPSGRNSFSYFPAVPLRTLLPILSITFAFSLLRTRHEAHASPRGWRFVALGLLVGATVLNNQDFGLPAAVAVLSSVALVSREWPAVLRTLSGAVAFAIAYAFWATWAAQLPSAQYVMVFQRIFGVRGLNAVAMPDVGLHVAFAALFITATVLGALALLSRDRRGSARLADRGLLLYLLGCWSLLSMAYYASRSLTPTLIGGHALQAGLVCATLFPQIDIELRRMHAHLTPLRPLVISSLALALTAIAWSLSMIALVLAPSAAVEWNRDGHGIPVFETQEQLLREARLPAGTEQLLVMPALTSLVTGVPAHPVVNSPEYLASGRSIAELQCREGWPPGTTGVVMSEATAAGMRRAAACREILDFRNSRRLASVSVLVPLHRAS